MSTTACRNEPSTQSAILLDTVEAHSQRDRASDAGRTLNMLSSHNPAFVGAGVPSVVPSIVPSNDINPLLSLATLATSMYQRDSQQEEMKRRKAASLISTPPPRAIIPSATTPIRQSINQPPPMRNFQPQSILTFRAVLQRPATGTAWGITLSMLDSSCLVLGYVDRALVDRYVAIAARAWHMAPQNVVTLRTGDVIRSINGKPIASFPHFHAMTDYLKHHCHLSMIVVRALDLPLHLTLDAGPGHAYSTAEQAYRWLEPHLKLFKPNPRPKVVSTKLVSTEASFQVHRVAPKKCKPNPNPTPKILPFLFTNPLFRDDVGKPIPYDDDFEFNPQDGYRASQFLAPVDCFQTWVTARKKTWRQNWKVYHVEDDTVVDAEKEKPISTAVTKDFWSPQGYASFQRWQSQRKATWQRKYSWNQRKKRRIEEVAEQVVHFPSSCDTEEQIQEWLRVRKSQWSILRVKRQRKLEQSRISEDLVVSLPATQAGTSSSVDDSEIRPVVATSVARRQATGDMLLIDSLLDEQECKRRAHLETFDLAFVFDAKLGAPDDVIAHCLRYLPSSEHGKLLCISAKTSEAISQRDDMWRQLCPTHWILPRRPRKRWYDLYISKMRIEVQASRKRSDDLLSRIASVLFKGDHLHKVEKLVAEGERKFDFDVNYLSGVVCERNSMLNLAVINGRLKIARWLVETKGADRESCDRGGFTPLINAAWNGSMKDVRFLLGKGCDRSKIGTGHYTKPLAAPDFEGHNAEGWARENGFSEVADLIRVGL
mmetsp:Transcript_3373/g.5541  ORF Transcript_3373/g.5541 Transcript_3373/m.5541 type:complete len:768 (-) Transcript_3373:70-2373(-)